jgi:hypothetical protein
VQPRNFLSRLAAWAGVRGRVVPGGGADAVSPSSACTTTRTRVTDRTATTGTGSVAHHSSHGQNDCEADGQAVVA